VFVAVAMAEEIIKYRGYEIHIDPDGAGLKVSIKGSGSFSYNPRIPFSSDKTRREQLIADAKALVDALLDPPHVKK
jgi:hypothetical protein